MITIWIPMSAGRHFLFGCAVLATDASHPCPAEAPGATLAPGQPAQEHRVPLRLPSPDGA